MTTKDRIFHTFRESGLCFDSARLLEHARKTDRLRVFFFRYLRLRVSPAIIPNTLRLGLTMEEKGKLFSLALSHLNVAGTYKTTGACRTKLADAAITRLLQDTQKGRILEVGVSDGTSAMELIKEVEGSAEVVLSDRHPMLYFKKLFPGLKHFLDGEGRTMGFKLGWFYLALIGQKKHDTTRWTPLNTLNPQVAARTGAKSIRQFNIFTDILQPKATLIKCANILNTTYFSNNSIREAVANLSRSINSNGWIVVSQNNEAFPDNEAYFILKKEDKGLVVTEEQNGHPVRNLFL